MAMYTFYDEHEDVPFRYLTPTRMVGTVPPPYETDMTPGAYLEFAIEDLKDGSTRSLVNSFGNAKRAIHLAVDTLLHQYGLFRNFQRRNFPTKLEVLDDVGILPTAIIKNLNVERNALEHEYATPSRRRVEEAVDVTKLLILATDSLLERTPHECVVGWRDPSRHALLQIDPIEGELHVTTLSAPKKYKKINGVSCIAGNIRTFGGGAFVKGVKVSAKPWKVMPLDRTHAKTWKPIVRELVGVQRKEGARRSFVDKETATMTIPVSLPMTLPDDMSWHDTLNEVLGEKIDEMEKAGKSKET